MLSLTVSLWYPSTAKRSKGAIGLHFVQLKGASVAIMLPCCYAVGKEVPVMDSKTLGPFIAEQRKLLGMTQADLAAKLHVTDKAVSRWERGLGLPDINTIEPLAEALEVSIAEVMRAEKTTEGLTEQDASKAIKDVLDMVEKKRMERRRIYLITGCIALLLAVIFVIDNMGVMGFVGVFLVCLGLVAGIGLILYSIIRRRRKLPSKATLTVGLLLLLIPILFEIILVAGFLMGGGPS